MNEARLYFPGRCVTSLQYWEHALVDKIGSENYVQEYFNLDLLALVAGA